MSEVLPGTVQQVCSSPEHALAKPVQKSIMLLAGLGVEGDAHAGRTVKHRSRVRANPNQPNLRQVHLIQAELHDELGSHGMPVDPGAMGENITTRGLDLLRLPAGTILRLGDAAIVGLTGLRNPCTQLDSIHPGLMAATLGRTEDGEVIRKAGVMSVVLRDGEVRAGDTIQVELPPEPHQKMDRV